MKDQGKLQGSQLMLKVDSNVWLNFCGNPSNIISLVIIAPHGPKVGTREGVRGSLKSGFTNSSSGYPVGILDDKFDFP